MAIERFSKWRPSAILDLWNSNFLIIGAVKGHILHQRTKFYKDRSNRYGDIAIFVWFFKMAVAAMLNFQKFENFTVFSKWRPSVILDLLGADWDHPRRLLDGLYRYAKFRWIGCSSFDNIQLSIFCPFGLKTLIHAPKIGVFGRFHPWNGEQCQRNPQKAHSCASPRCLSHQAWKSVDGSDL